MTREDFLGLVQAMMEHDLRPTHIVMHPKAHALIDYRLKTKVIKEWPGALRMRGPDGKTWLEKKWRTADVNYGSGNRARRRAGLPIYNNTWE